MRIGAVPARRMLAGVTLAALVVAAIAGVAWLLQGNAHQNALVAASKANADGTRTDYVGYAQDGFSATAGYDASAVAASRDAWRAAHPGAQILSEDPVNESGLTIGSAIHYR